MQDILRFSSPNFCDVNDAMNCIQGSLQSKDVLVVLDDVSDMDQIKKLVGMGDWVGLGSRVIITTRNLSCVANVEDIENNVMILEGKKIFIYQMRELDYDNSLQLLCRHAVGQHVPFHGYEQLTCEVISFTRGVPLAIEGIGSYLKGKRLTVWKEMLNKLTKVPHARLYQEILMSSYETLCDEEKEIFLDIAFFFAGHDKTSAFYYWESCGLFPEMSVDTLISYALVKITYGNEFWMHDLLKDLGREVVRKQSNGNLRMCSRLCNEDAKRLLLKREGTKHVKALKLDSTHSYNFTPAELSGLSGLTFLELCGGNFIGDFEDCGLSELRWLSWRDCALDFRGTNFYLENLVVLKLSNSSITESWTGWEQFKTARNLKVLELQYLDLTTTPDLSSFLSLERLTFCECYGLAHIDPSIGNLESLNSLEMIKSDDWHHFGTPNLSLQLPSSICNLTALSKLVIQGFKLNQLPENIGELKGLKVMEITGCEFLRTLPNSIGDLESLIDLDLYEDGITELPESIGKLRNLIEMNVSNNRLRRLPSTIGDLDRLEVLNASDNEELQGEIPDEFVKLRSVKSLDLWRTGICGLPSMMVQLSRLESLQLGELFFLPGLPDLPTSLTHLVISSTTRYEIWRNLTVEPSLMPAPYSSTEFVNVDPSTCNAECVNSLETTNHPWSPADVSPGKSRFICNITALSTLVICRTKWKQLPENIGKLKGLKDLTVTRCEFLRTLPDSIGDLESLIDLDLSEDGITELPESIGKLRNLTKMNVSNNRLRRLPATIGHLDRLEVLDARSNEELQGEIPDEFGKLRSLKSLRLSRTGICGLPSMMVQLASLGLLHLKCCNEIQELPELPTSLRELKISSRSLKAFPNLSGVTNLVNLSLLKGDDHDDYGHNPQVPPYSCDRLDQLSRLRHLQLSCPNPSLLGFLPPGLEQLSIYHSTSLSSWERLSNLVRLRRLNLHKSIASEIRLDGLESLTNLTCLGISNCEFLERVHDISRLRKLWSLFLVDCTKLVEIGGLAQPPESLRRLEVRGCHSILCFPDRLETASPSELSLIVEDCRKLGDYDGPCGGYIQGGMNPK